MDLDNLQIFLICVWFAYGVGLGFRNTLYKLLNIFARQDLQQHTLGQLSDIAWWGLTGYLYLTLIY